MDIEKVKGLLQGLAKGGERSGLQVLELRDKPSIGGFPSSLQSEGWTVRIRLLGHQQE